MLDGVRGLVVLLVLSQRLVYCSGIDRQFWPDLQLFRLAFTSGLGVDLFFVLSGIPMTGILHGAARGHNSYDKHTEHGRDSWR